MGILCHVRQCQYVLELLYYLFTLSSFKKEILISISYAHGLKKADWMLTFFFYKLFIKILEQGKNNMNKTWIFYLNPDKISEQNLKATFCLFLKICNPTKNSLECPPTSPFTFYSWASSNSKKIAWVYFHQPVHSWEMRTFPRVLGHLDTRMAASVIFNISSC